MLKLRYGHADPREAGVGNIVNCGAAMYIAPSGSRTRATPDGPTGRRSSLRAPTRRATGARRRVCSPPASPRRCDRRPPSRASSRSHWAREGRHPRGDRGGRASRVPSSTAGATGGSQRCARAFAPFDSVGEATRRPRRTPGSRAGCTRSRSCPRARPARGDGRRLRRDRPRRCQLRPRFGLDRLDGRRARRRARRHRRVPRDWVEDVSAASRIDVEEAGREMAAVASRSSPKDVAAPRGAGPRHGGADRRRSACVRVTWVQPEDLVGHELRQAREEGKDPTVESRWLAAGGCACTGTGRLAGAVAPGAPRPRARAARRARRDPAAACRRRAGGASTRSSPLPTCPAAAQPVTDLADRIEGAWLGRAAGCVLGKPVEGDLARRDPRDRRGDGQLARPRLVHGEGASRRGLGALAVEPRQPADEPRREHLRAPGGRRPQLHDARRRPARARRAEFDSLDVAKLWLDYQPPGRIFTAERVAVRNLLEAHLPPETATCRNPFREWIGARLRVDAYGGRRPAIPSRRRGWRGRTRG